jgi:DNA damage-inducible protein 1
MLYIDIEINGHIIKALVDSGAQVTIMSPSCAESCGIMRLMDDRYSGIAKGVGTARILGRVHHVEIGIGGAIMPGAFTVMEGKNVDLLFGLDLLKQYKAKIDLEKNALCFQNIEVPFLAEHEIPKDLEAAQMDEPTIPGPNGTEIGGHTGAIRPKGSPATDVASGSAAASSSASAPTAAPTSQPSASDTFNEEQITQLMNLGFPRQAAIEALRATGGNVEYAAGLLFGGNE